MEATSDSRQILDFIHTPESAVRSFTNSSKSPANFEKSRDSVAEPAESGLHEPSNAPTMTAANMQTANDAIISISAHTNVFEVQSSSTLTPRPTHRDEYMATIGLFSPESDCNIDWALLHDQFEREVEAGGMTLLNRSSHISENIPIDVLSPSSMNMLQSLQARTIPTVIDSTCLSSLDMFLWHHFITETAADLMPFNSKASDIIVDLENPFLTHFPRLAFIYPYLLSATLALSALHYDRKNGTDNFKNHNSILLLDAQTALLTQSSQLNHNFQSLLALLATSAVLCFCQIYSTNTRLWYENLQISRFLSSMVLEHPQRMYEEEDFVCFLLVVQSYLEICSRLSFGTFQSCSQELGFEMSKVENGSAYQHISHDTTIRRVIDPLLAFSSRLVDPLLRIGQYVQKLKDTSNSTRQVISDLELPEQITDDLYHIKTQELEELEETLLQAEDADREDLTASTNDNQEYRAMNEAMHAAAFILYYGRLRNLPATSRLIRRKVAKIVWAAQTILVRSKTSIALLFPLVIAGCDAVDSSDRSFIAQCVHELQGTSLCDCRRILQMLQATWRLRDENPQLYGLEWQTEGMLGFLAQLILHLPVGSLLT